MQAIDYYLALKQPEEAAYYFDKDRPTLATINKFILYYTNNKDNLNALSWFDRIKFYNLLPNDKSYNMIMSMYGKTKRLNEALWWYSIMIKDNVTITLETYSILMQLSGNIEWLNIMLKNGIKPNANIYISMINKYCKEAVKNNADTSSIERAFSTDPIGSSDTRSIGSVEKGFNKMLESPLMQAQKIHADPFNSIMNMFSKLCRVDDVLAWFHIMQYNHNIEPDKYTYNIIIEMYSRLGQPELALKWYNEVPYSDLVISNTILHMYGKLGDVQNAIKIYEEIPKPDIFTFVTLIDMWGKLNEPNEMERYYDLMGKKGIKSNTYIHTVMMRGSYWETALYHNNILEESSSLTNTSLSVFIDACGFNNQLSTLIDFWNRNVEMNYHLFNANTYTSMIEACCRCGDYQNATRILKDFESSHHCQTSTQQELYKLYTTYMTQMC